MEAFTQVEWKAVVLKDVKILASLALLVVSLVIRVNLWLSRRSRNNGLGVGRWDWSKEVVVITGGSNGIGKQTALLLAREGIKTVVIDSSDLSYTQREYMLPFLKWRNALMSLSRHFG